MNQETQLMDIEFKTKIPQQIEAAEFWCDNVTEEILYGGGKGGGKSFLGVSLIFGDALVYPETSYFIARKDLNDLRKFTMPTVNEVFQKWGLKLEDYAKYNGQDNFYQLYNKSKVYLISCKHEPSDPLFERFGSMQMTRGMIEEGGEVEESAKSNLWLSIGRWKNKEYGLKKKLLITANPKKGWMKREFIDPLRSGNLPPSRKFVKALATDNTYLDPDYVQTLANEKDLIRRQRLYLGDWEYDESKDSIVSYDAMLNTFFNPISVTNEKYLIVDVARFGGDSSTFHIWRGRELVQVIKKTKQGTDQTAMDIKEICIVHGIPRMNVMVDEDGIGGGVVDNVKGVRGFVANSSPLPTRTEIRVKNGLVKSEFVPKANFANLKSQCAWKLAEMMNEYKLSFSIEDETMREEILGDLSALLKQKDPDSDGKLQIKPKSEVKKELGRSPDVGDPIIMRMWFELRSEAIDEDPQQEKTLSKQRETLVARGNRNVSTR